MVQMLIELDLECISVAANPELVQAGQNDIFGQCLIVKAKGDAA
jgi:hypothetical protein